MIQHIYHRIMQQGINAKCRSVLRYIMNKWIYVYILYLLTTTDSTSKDLKQNTLQYFDSF